MALTIAPTALPAPKKGTFYQVFLVVTAGLVAASYPVVWTVSSGTLPAFLTLARVSEVKVGGTGDAPGAAVAVVSGKVPNTLDPATWSATITATAADAAVGTVVSTSIVKVVDGPDAQGFHGTEANRSTVTLLDAIDHGPGLAVADYIQRMWPLTGPSQNS
jgi:hypothetical protein